MDKMEILYIVVMTAMLVCTIMGFLKSKKDYKMYKELVLMYQSLSAEEQTQFMWLRSDWLAEGHSQYEVDRRLHVVMTHYIQDLLMEECRNRMEKNERD